MEDEDGNDPLPLNATIPYHGEECVLVMKAAATSSDGFIMRKATDKGKTLFQSL